MGVYWFTCFFFFFFFILHPCYLFIYFKVNNMGEERWNSNHRYKKNVISHYTLEPLCVCVCVCVCNSIRTTNCPCWPLLQDSKRISPCLGRMPFVRDITSLKVMNEVKWGGWELMGEQLDGEWHYFILTFFFFFWWVYPNISITLKFAKRCLFWFLKSKH